ncbi:hypothetical protein J3R82DRAFT_3380 [Butyriboletus roseoflavus]|nr:hypothetical protein J3R82DRAFT_3380 [Butyriboletus roseoflavus]
MNAYTNIDSQVLRITARVKSALDVIPRIVRPKEAWETWMRNGLQSEIKKVPKASASSPWPTFLMRVKTVLCLYYYSAMQISTFDIDEVQSDDPSLLGDDCVDLPLDALPDLMGDDLWWTVVPPSVSLKESMPHPSLLEPPAQHEQLPMPMLPDDVGTAPSTRNDIRSQYEPKMKWKVRDLSHAPASHWAPILSGSKDTRIEVVTTSTSKTTNQVFNHQGIRDIRTAGITGASTATPAPAGSPDLSPVRNPKRSERAGKEDVPVRPLKKKKQFKSTEFTNEEDDAQAGPFHAIRPQKKWGS